MKEARLSTALVALGALAPLILLGIFLVAGSFYNARVQVEQETRSRSAGTNARIDAELMIDRGSLMVLASSSSIKNRDWPAARHRALEVQAVRAKWRNVLLTGHPCRKPVDSFQAMTI